MEYIKNSNNATIVLDIIDAIHENASYLSEIDGAIGDGDHGINMNKGFMLAKERITSDMSLSEAFKILGRTLVMDIGGSMGPIYGTLFSRFSKITKDTETIKPEIVLAALEDVIEKLTELAGAKLGDKTLIDTLYPAKEAYKRALKGNQGYAQALQAMSSGAEAGKENTKNLTAKIGRAARLGKRSKGFLDAGAASCYIILKTMAESMGKVIIDEQI
jgi:dihydroxyacetone kinase-like protein